MTVTELRDLLNKYIEYIGCDGKVIGSHDCPSYVRFVLDTEDDVIELKLLEGDLRLELRLGCLCPEGVTFVFVKDEE